MKKADLLAAVKGKAAPFTTPLGLKVDLRPLSLPERIELLAWIRSSDDPHKGEQLQLKYVALGVCDGDGDRMFAEEEEVARFPFAAVDFDAIADEVATRAGLYAVGKAPPATSPATPS